MVRVRPVLPGVLGLREEVRRGGEGTSKGSARAEAACDGGGGMKGCIETDADLLGAAMFSEMSRVLIPPSGARLHLPSALLPVPVPGGLMVIVDKYVEPGKSYFLQTSQFFVLSDVLSMTTWLGHGDSFAAQMAHNLARAYAPDEAHASRCVR